MHKPVPLYDKGGSAMSKQQEIKLIIWDLDNTLWQGTLSENTVTGLTEGIRQIIETLDARGILQSIASKNDFEPAMAQLKQWGLNDYFLYPQINWHPKSENIREILKKINLAADAPHLLTIKLLKGRGGIQPAGGDLSGCIGYSGTSGAQRDESAIYHRGFPSEKKNVSE